MNTPPLHASLLKYSPRPVHGWLIAVAWLCLSSSLTAQSVLIGEPKLTLTPRVIQKDITADPASSDVLAGPETESSIAIGDIKLRPQLLLRYMQIDGLPFGPGNSIDSSVFTFAPGLSLELGSNWIVSYTPTWINYSEKSLNDTVSQSVNVIGAAKAGEWTFQLSETFLSSRDILVETATQTKQRNWATTVSGERKVGQRSSYDGTISLIERYGDFPVADAKTWTTNHWLRSQFTRKLNAGLGFGLSKTDFSGNNDMHTEEFMGSVRWQTTEKVDLSVQGGIENRHFDSAGVGSLRSPTMEITLGYRPFPQTRITVASTRAVAPAVSTDQVTRSSGWSVALNQRLLEKLNLSMTYYDQSNNYKSTTTVGLPTGRSDDYTSFNATLGVKILKKWTLAAIYQSTKNSSDKNFSFSTDQYGVEFSGSF